MQVRGKRFSKEKYWSFAELCVLANFQYNVFKKSVFNLSNDNLGIFEPARTKINLNRMCELFLSDSLL